MTRPTRRQGILRTALLVATLNYSIAFLFGGGAVRPVNPYGFINETLTLTCTVTNAPGNISGELYFKKTYKNEVKVLPMQYITPTRDRSIRLDYPITSELDQGQYTCIRKTKGFIAEQRVHVEYRPKKVEKIDCRVFDWRNMTCTWDLGVDFIHKDMVKSELYWEIKGGANKCPHPGEKTCTWREFEEGNRLYSNLKLYQTYFMQVNVTVHTKESEESLLATAASDVFTINPLNLVEPAPVHSLTVENMTSTCLSLRWNHGQQSMRRMMYTVHVLQEQGSVLKFNTSEREVTVCDLHPARRYELQVSCIPLSYGSNKIRGFYSDLTSIEVETLEDVPSGVPGVRLGSFVSGDCESSPCYATIYWKPIPPEVSNGKITLYKIQQRDTQNGTSKVMEVAGSATSYDLLVGEDREYNITLRGGTQVGMSGESNPIVLPAYNKVPQPSDIVVEADSSTLYITWGVPPGSQDPHQGRVTGYTLYYCNGSKITSKCEDTIHWHPFASDVRHYELNVQDGNLDNKMIGVSAVLETADRNVSSGIRWNTCVYRRNLVPPSPRGVVFSSHQPDNALSVEWTKFVCAETPIYVSYYVVSHCITNNHGGCAGLSVQVNVSNTKERQVIQGLSAGVNYRVTLRAVSRSGEGPESKPITRVVVNSDLTSWQIAGISLGGIVSCIVFVSFVICCIRKLHKTYNSMTLEIKLPPLTEVDENEQHIIRKTVTIETHNEKLRKGTQTSTIEKKPNNNENTLTHVEKVNPQTPLMSGHDTSEKPKTNLETAQIPQDDLKPLCKLVDTPCSGRECDQVKTSLQNKTDTSSSLPDNCLKFALSGNSESTRQDAGSNYITRDISHPLPSPCDAPFDESPHSSGQDTASSPPPPYEPPRSPDDQKLETPPSTYSYYVSLSQADFPSAPKEMFPPCTNSHPLSTLLEHQSSSSSPSDVPNDQTQPHGESIGPQGLNIAPKLQSETDSPYIPLDKVSPPPPPEEQKTVSSPADGYVSVSDASQHQSPSHFPSDVSFDQFQSDEVAAGPRGHNIAHKPPCESHATDGSYIPLDKVQPPPPPVEQKTVSPSADGSDASQHQSPSHFPSDVSFDQFQSDEVAAGPRGHNIAHKPPCESHATDGSYIPLDKVQPPPPPVEQKTVSPSADGYVSVSDA